MQRLDSVHLECETITAQVATKRQKSLNVPMSLTEDAEAKGQKKDAYSANKTNEAMHSNQITCDVSTI
jgi:hypothetical protein